jgi:hypothetical protein
VKRILRSLLVCFLLLALPFQAFASASMRPLVAGLGSAAHAHTSMAAELPPCHQGAAMKASMDTKDDDSKDHDGRAGQHAKGKAGTCAACCVGAAVASGLSAALALAPPRFVSIPFRAGYLPSVDPVLPERPPSTLLA